MKRYLFLLSFPLLIGLGMLDCSSSKQSTSSTPSAPMTAPTGNWAITSIDNSGFSNTLQATLVSIPCGSVTTPAGPLSEQGTSCSLADNQTGQGSISAISGYFGDHRIARAVGKIGENDGVFLGECSCGLRRVRAEIERSRDYNCDKNNGNRNQNLPEFPPRHGNFGNLHSTGFERLVTSIS